MKKALKTKAVDVLTQQPNKKRFLTSKAANFIFMVLLFSTVLFALPTFAAPAAGGSEALNTAKTLLAKAAQAGGGLWAIWGLVQLGMSIKDHNGPGIQGAIWQIIGGGIVIAAGVAISSMSLDFSA